MNLILDPLTFPFFVRALAASAIVGLVCATVGSFLVLRGMAFMGDALSHSAFPGVVAAYLIGAPFYFGASIAAVGTALAIGWVTRQGKIRGDTAIGVLFAGMFALGVFMLSMINNYVGELSGFLFGEVLGIGLSDLISLAVLAALVLAIVALLWKELLYSTFDPLGAAASGLPVGRLDYLMLALIALTIVISLQSVGIILVVAVLVTPAATAQLISRSFGRLVVIAGAMGVVCPIIGLYASFWLNSATGATIVLIETSGFFLVLVGTSIASRLRRPEPEAPAA